MADRLSSAVPVHSHQARTRISGSTDHESTSEDVMTVHPSKLSLTSREALGFTEAECLYDPELHTGPEDAGECPEEGAARRLVAAEVCLACPLLWRCLRRAVVGSPEPGVWGSFDAETLTASAADGNTADHALSEVA